MPTVFKYNRSRTPAPPFPKLNFIFVNVKFVKPQYLRMLKAIYIYIDILHNNALLSVRLSVLVLIYGRYLFHLITLINDNPAYLVKYHIMLPIQLLQMKNNLNLPVLYNSNRTQVHGRPAVIVYTSMCTSIVFLT